MITVSARLLQKEGSGKDGKMQNCDACIYFEYDEDEEGYLCTVNMDEDDYARLLQGLHTACPYYRHEDEYQVVRHQM